MLTTLLVFGLVAGFLSDGPVSRDWVADLAGFVAGFGVTVLVSPGGWSRALGQLRRR